MATDRSAAPLIRQRYQLNRRLGDDHGVVTWLADDLLERRTVICRILRTEHFDPSKLLPFCNTLLSYRHPHIAELLDYGGDGAGEIFLVHTFLDAVPLGRALHNQTARPAELPLLLRQALTAFTGLHACGAAHGEVGMTSLLVEQQAGVPHLRLAGAGIGLLRDAKTLKRTAQRDLSQLLRCFADAAKLLPQSALEAKKAFSELLQQLQGLQANESAEAAQLLAALDRRLPALAAESLLWHTQPPIALLQPSRQQCVQDMQQHTSRLLGQRRRQNVPAMFLVGTPGSGKSTLLQELCGRLRLAGEQLIELPAHRLGDAWRRCLQWLEADRPDAGDAPQDFADRFAAALRRRFRNQAIYFVVDDLEAATAVERQEFLDAWRRLALQPQSMRPFLIAGMSQAARMTLSDWFEQISRHPGLELPLILDLPPLTDAEALEMARQKSGEIPEPLLAAVVEESGGLPGPLENLLQQLRQQVIRDAGWAGISDTQLRQWLREQRRNHAAGQAFADSHMTPEARRLCRLVACCAQGMPLAWLQESGLFTAQQQPVLQWCLAHGWLKHREAQLTLAEPWRRDEMLGEKKTRSAIRGELLAGLRQLQQRLPTPQLAAEVLEQRLLSAEAHDRPTAAEVLLQIQALEQAGLPLRMVSIVEAAAESLAAIWETQPPTASVLAGEGADAVRLARRLIGWTRLEAAKRLLRPLLRWCENFQQSARAGEPAGAWDLLYLEALEQWVRLQRFIGNFEEARLQAGRGLELARRLQLETPLQAFSSLSAILSVLGGDYRRAGALAEAALQRGGGDAIYQVQLWTNLGHSRRGLNDLAAAATAYQEGLNLAKRVQYADGIANLEQSLGILNQLLGNQQRALEHMQHAHTLFSAQGNWLGVYSCAQSRALLHIDAGDLQQALELFAGCLVFYRGHQHKRMLAATLLENGRLLCLMGARREGEADMRQAAWLSGEQGFTHLASLCHWHLALQEMRRGAWKDAEIHLDAATGLLNSENATHESSKLQWARQQMRVTHDAAVTDDIAEPVTEELWDGLAALMEGGIWRSAWQPALDGARAELHAIQMLPLPTRLTRLFSLWRAAELQGVPLPADLRRAYAALHEKVLDKLPASRREAWRRRWLSMQPAARSLPLPTAGGADEQLRRLQHVLDLLMQTKSLPQLLRGLLRELGTLSGADRGVLIYTAEPMDASTEPWRAWAVVDNERLPTLPADLQILGWQSSGAAFAPRKQRQSVELYGRMLGGEWRAGELQNLPEGGWRLWLPLRGERALQGGILLQGAGALAAEMRLCIETVLAQLPLYLRRFAAAPRRLRARTAAAGVVDEPVSRSAAMQKLLQAMQRMQGSSATVLIEGESGSGKEWVARRLHELSGRKGAWLAVDCGALREELFEAQFFGYVKGSFTGAHEDRAGYLQSASGGTLFLDNIGVLQPTNQAKLLRAIQERELRRVGSTRAEKFDVRILAASQGDLGALAQAGKFRLDLYYRLDVVRLQVPPLRERREDIAGLIEIFLRQRAAADQTLTLKLSPEALRALQNYDWPGNVRELFNEIERLLIAADDTSRGAGVPVEALSERVTAAAIGSGKLKKALASKSVQQGIGATLTEVERQLIRQALAKHSGNIARVAKELKIARFSLRRRMRKLGIVGED